MRRIVGTKGFIRAPVVLDEGEDWLLETAVTSDRIRGGHAVDTAAAAVTRLIELNIPRGPRAARAPLSAPGGSAPPPGLLLGAPRRRPRRGGTHPRRAAAPPPAEPRRLLPGEPAVLRRGAVGRRLGVQRRATRRLRPDAALDGARAGRRPGAAFDSALEIVGVAGARRSWSGSATRSSSRPLGASSTAGWTRVPASSGC